MTTTEYSAKNLFGMTTKQMKDCIAQSLVNVCRPFITEKYGPIKAAAICGAVWEACMSELSEKDLSDEELAELVRRGSDPRVVEERRLGVIKTLQL